MKIRSVVLILCVIPIAVLGAERVTGNARVGMTRGNTGVRMTAVSKASVEKRAATNTANKVASGSEDDAETETQESMQDTNCRDTYQACMDEFCLLDETEGARCACSDNIEKSKSLIQEIQKIQAEADELYTTGVEREKLGAKAKLVFGESDTAKKKSLKSGIDFSSWLNGGTDDGELGEDNDIGQNLYSMAAESCADELKKCGNKSDMEEKLYSRMIVKDCKAFESYLKDQKADANANKKTAEAAVRSARLEMSGTTNKYNRGECLLVYRSCIADKGGCGVNFENCLDEGLLARRANACEDVLDQCMSVRDVVVQDWQEESVAVLKDAAKYADRNQRATCLAKIQNCLEEGCSTSTESACLTDVKVAAGICPIITECNDKIPGLQSVINDKLGYLQTKFCENDIDSCLKDKCGVDFTKPECVGKKSTEIAELCPQSMFPSCKNAVQYDVLVSSVMLHMDYQLLTGCINQFSEKLTAVCGTDMNCLPVSELLAVTDKQGNPISMNKWVDLNSVEGKELRSAVWQAAEKAVDKFFEEFDQDKTLSACQDVYGKGSTKVKGRSSVKDSVNLAAKMVAKSSAKNRADRELASVMDELKMKEEQDRNAKYCIKKYKEESAPAGSDSKNYTYIRSVTYEPKLQNCHVCRVQQVCETGGESKTTTGLKTAAGWSASLASAGTMISPGWGTAIGAAAGGLIGLTTGLMADGEQEFCQQLESCEDINVGNITEDMLKGL